MMWFALQIRSSKAMVKIGIWLAMISGFRPQKCIHVQSRGVHVGAENIALTYNYFLNEIL